METEEDGCLGGINSRVTLDNYTLHTKAVLLLPRVQ